MGFYRAWLFGERAIDHMDAMTAPDGYPRAEAWLPLDVVGTFDDGLKQWRSAWVQCPPENGEVWIEFGLPTPLITEYLGPRALISDFGMGHGKALRSNVRKREGTWMVKVPRFFETVTKFWTTEPQDDALLSTTNGQKTAATTVGTLDVEVSRDRFRNEPELIVGPDGPMVFGPLDYRYRSTLDWEKRLDAALHSLLQMPSTTPVTAAWCRF
jgi:hypothetical protein